MEGEFPGRRRLSITQVEPARAHAVRGAAGEERGGAAPLFSESIMGVLEELGAEGQRRTSIGSVPDQATVSFADKAVEELGDRVDPARWALGFTCRKGLKPESPNQDSWSVLRVDGDFSVYSVFDGHGQKGHEVSNFVKESLLRMLVKDRRFRTPEMPALLREAFLRTQGLIGAANRTGRLSAQRSGTTATVVVHDHGQGKMTISHVADSSAVLGRYRGQELEAVQLTRDHKPDLKDERARIEKGGGRVVFDGYANYRIYARNARYPGLNMSRCLGDLAGHLECGITAEPEVTERSVEKEDHVLLLCSDGVWEFIKPLEAVTIVSAFAPEKAMMAAERLAKEAWDRWIREEGGAVVDDITVVLVYLNCCDSDRGG